MKKVAASAMRVGLVSADLICRCEERSDKATPVIGRLLRREKLPPRNDMKTFYVYKILAVVFGDTIPAKYSTE
jgi:hypothetical protein